MHHGDLAGRTTKRDEPQLYPKVKGLPKGKLSGLVFDHSHILAARVTLHFFPLEASSIFKFWQGQLLDLSKFEPSPLQD